MNQTIDSQEKLTISDYRYWLNLKIFIRTLAAGALLLCALLYWVERSKPPEGYIFERLPPIVGEWGRERGSLRTTFSYVGETGIACSFPYIFYSGGISSCSELNIPYGTSVSVVYVRIPVLVPYLEEQGRFVQKISSSNQVFQEFSDETIRNIWLRVARSSVSRFVLDLVIFFYCVQIIIFRRFFRK